MRPHLKKKETLHKEKYCAEKLLTYNIFKSSNRHLCILHQVTRNLWITAIYTIFQIHG